ncbi:localization factor PodJL [Chelatococcus caeni]|uniref:Localization factor PodJL n=1 Tax=Chelatococcus caeni TaxID=1348468 RepID=A0A840BWF1_9HYPH|nr:tetratricopeptide repeat protein [Chelatococcus caeni]MBB4017280.1 localization factor PodJL [Chelatococcus caeni]
MAQTAPWSVKGIDPQARDAAKEAARKAGMTLGAWLSTIIADQAADGDSGTPPPGRDSLAAVSERLARFAREHTQTAAPPRRPQAGAGLDMPSLDEIVARVSERSLAETRAAAARTASALDSVARWMERTETHVAESARAMADRQDETAGAIGKALIAIGRRLGDIEQHLAADRAPNVAPRWHEDADALRDALDDVGERLEAIAATAGDEAGEEETVGPLMSEERAARRRLEAAVAEIRRRQRELDNSPTLGERFAAMNRRLDERPRRNHAPIAREAAAHDRTAPSLGEEAIIVRLEALSRKIDEALRPVAAMPIGDVLARLDRLDERLEQPAAAPDLARIEGMIHALTARIEEVRTAETDTAGLDALERQIGQLAERIDAVGAAPALAERERIAHGMASLERTMADLLADMRHQLREEMRELQDGTAEAIEQAARRAAEAARTALPDAYEAVPAEIGQLKRDLAELKTTQASTDLRTQDTLEAVHETLERIVDRLALLEEDMTDGPSATGAPSRLSEDDPADSVEFEDLRTSLDALLRANEPSRSRGDEVAPPARPAAADAPTPRAALAALLAAQPAEDAPPPAKDAKPAAPAFDEAPTAAVKASFIAAARRAAQAAAAETAAALPDTTSRARETEAAERTEDPVRALRAEPRPTAATRRNAAASPVARLRNGVAARRKPLLIGLAAIVIAVGAAQVLSGLAGKSLPTGDAEPAAAHDATAPAPREEAEAPSSRPAQADAPTPDAFNPFAANPFAPDTGPATTGSLPATPGIPDSAPPPAPAPEQNSRLDEGLPASLLIPPSYVADLPAEGLPAPLRKAAAAGETAAVYEVATRLAEGRGVPRDVAKAARLFEAAATGGLVPAQYRIASHYEKGIGVARDVGTARMWYEKAAEAGNARAMHNLGVLYAEGITGKPDYETAVKWFSKAAEFGVRDSQFNLAVLLARGLGTERNLVASYTWLSVLARDGDKDAAAKRDELARSLTASELAIGKAAFARWQVKVPVRAANEVPAGGWELSAAAPSPGAQKPPGKVSRL